MIKSLRLIPEPQCRTCVVVAALGLNADVEIECTAFAEANRDAAVSEGKHVSSEQHTSPETRFLF